jgi:hypothetical protein
LSTEWSQRSILEKSEKLHALGLRCELKPGVKLARKFADLGYEEFLVMPDFRLLSLCTGDCREIVPGEEAHFFVVPSVDFMIERIDVLGYDILRVDYIDRRIWRLEMKSPEGKEIVFEAGRFEDVFMDALYALIPQMLDS